MRALLALALLIGVVWARPGKYDNPMENEGLFEGDIKGIDPKSDRNAVPYDSQLWKAGVVPYVIESSISGITNMILQSMRHIEQKTCIRFVPKTSAHKDYVSIYKENGCWSYWGLLSQGEQKLSLGPGCEYFGTVVHELLHAIGFEHEHNRSDRDDHLEIHWDNIKKEWFYAFEKLKPNQNRALTAFDFESIMLYGSTSFSKQWGLKSMTARNGRFMEEVYNKKALSADDIKRINILYKCPNTM